ncbi:hypothetical protein Tco_0972569 [Tanacetum coccineum]
MLRDNALTELRKKFEKAKKERDDLKLTLNFFENSSKNLSKLLEIQVSDKFNNGVGFDSQVFDSQENDKYKTSKEYPAVPPPYTGNFMPPKSDFVLAGEDEYVFNRISDSEDENETKSKSKQRKSSFAKVEFVKSNEHVKTPKESVKKLWKLLLLVIVSTADEDCRKYSKSLLLLVVKLLLLVLVTTARRVSAVSYKHSRIMDEFHKFAAKEGESLESVYERLTTLVNIMDRNNVRPITVEINTKFLNCLQPEWSKYVTMVRQNQAGKAVSYDELYDSLVQFEPHVLASRAKKAAKNHDPLALIAHSNASSSHPYAYSSYSL